MKLVATGASQVVRRRWGVASLLVGEGRGWKVRMVVVGVGVVVVRRGLTARMMLRHHVHHTTHGCHGVVGGSHSGVVLREMVALHLFGSLREIMHKTKTRCYVDHRADERMMSHDQIVRGD